MITDFVNGIMERNGTSTALSVLIRLYLNPQLEYALPAITKNANQITDLELIMVQQEHTNSIGITEPWPSTITSG